MVKSNRLVELLKRNPLDAVRYAFVGVDDIAHRAVSGSMIDIYRLRLRHRSTAGSKVGMMDAGH